MNMKTLSGLGIGALIFAESAFAASITQVFTLPQTTTEITGTTGTGTFTKFQTLCPACGVLNSVTLEVLTDARLMLLTVTNTSPTQLPIEYFTSLNASLVGTDIATDRALLTAAEITVGNQLGLGATNDIFDSGMVVYGVGQTKQFAPPVVTRTNDTGAVASSNVPFYNAAGTFTLGFTTRTNQTFIAGGNPSINQVTTAGGVVTVVYNYSPALNGFPEPATAVLLGSALAGLALMRRRIRSRFCN